MQGPETRACRGVCREEPVQLASFLGASFAVEDPVHQAVGVVNIHGRTGRRSESSSRILLRASNSRDLTVFSSISRIRAISS